MTKYVSEENAKIEWKEKPLRTSFALNALLVSEINDKNMWFPGKYNFFCGFTEEAIVKFCIFLYKYAQIYL